MISPDTLLALTAFAFVSSITPGPNNLMLMASGANFGLARTVPHLLGVSIGFTAMIVVVGLGISQLFEAYPQAFVVLKVISVVYLLYLAWKIATASAPKAGEAGQKPITFTQAALFQWVNPKAWTMALTAVVAYAPHDGGWPALVIVALIFGAINLPSVGVWTLLGVNLRRLLTRPLYLRLFNFTAAALLVASLYPMVFNHT